MARKVRKRKIKKNIPNGILLKHKLTTLHLKVQPQDLKTAGIMQVAAGHIITIV